MKFDKRHISIVVTTGFDRARINENGELEASYFYKPENNLTLQEEMEGSSQFPRFNIDFTLIARPWDDGVRAWVVRNGAPAVIANQNGSQLHWFPSVRAAATAALENGFY